MTNSNRIIKDLAGSARRRGIEHYGEPIFAKMCLEFEQRIEASYDLALSVLVAGLDVKDMQLALVWLDGKGYGSIGIDLLGQLLHDLRERTKQDGNL